VLDGGLNAQAALRGKENVTIKGKLEYQACDDKECFNPGVRSAVVDAGTALACSPAAGCFFRSASINTSSVNGSSNGMVSGGSHT
jgi:hypothetical protein